MHLLLELIILLIAHVLVKAAFHTFVKYTKPPTEYTGLDVRNDRATAQNPVILVHGAVGSWNYMGDLALSLRDKGHHVYVVNLGSGDVSEEKRGKLLAKIDRVRQYHSYQQVDIVAHSMGGNSAFAALFSKDVLQLLMAS